MDGTFSVAPVIFSQLYIIHEPIGHDYNSKVFPLFYILTNEKSQQLYTQIFQEVKKLILDNNFSINTKFLMTYFKKQF